jgi:yecA family protein
LQQTLLVTANTIDYGHLDALLTHSGAPLSLSELHGGLCGLICTGGPKAAVGWLDSLVDDCEADDATLAELSQNLETLGNETSQALSGWSLEFEPMLPEDDEAIAARGEALGLWCHGFLAGLVIGGLDLGGADGALSGEVAELVRDFSEISRAGAAPNESENPDIGDRSLAELVEYVRVGAQLIFEELARSSGSDAQRTIH